MEINEKNKIYIRNIQIETNTDCNLNCEHCYLGSQKQKTIIQPEYIDALIENIYGIDELTILGGEITLHPEVVEMILTKLANSSLKINYINFVTNAKIKSEKIVELFNWFRKEHTTHPEGATFKISADKFHTSCSPDFTKIELKENIKWYYERCDGLVIDTYGFSRLYLNGNAKSLKIEDITEFKNVSIFNFYKHEANKLDYKAKCNDKGCENKGVHCVSNLELHTDGYLYNGVPVSPPLNERDYYNKLYSIGFILDDTMLNLVTNYNEICKQHKSWKYIPIKDDSFSFLLLRWGYLVKKYILEMNCYMLKNNPTPLDKANFSRIDNEVVKVANEIKNYCLNNKNQITPIERNLLSLYGKYGNDTEIFFQKTKLYKEGLITKHHYKEWSFDFIQKMVKPQNADDEKTYQMMDALYRWDLHTYQKIFGESYSIIAPYADKLTNLSANI